MAISPMYLAGLAVGGVGLLLHIIAMATPEWMTAGEYSRGIFKACASSHCGNIENPDSDLEAVRALAVIGCLAGVAGVGLGVLHLLLNVIRKSSYRVILLLAAGACVVGFIFIIIGVGVFAGEVYDPHKSLFDLGYSFALSIVGGILLLVGGLLIYFGGKSIG